MFDAAVAFEIEDGFLAENGRIEIAVRDDQFIILRRCLGNDFAVRIDDHAAGNHMEAVLGAGSMIVNPDGEIVAEAKTEDDELIVADCDLDATIFGKETIFDFKRHRRIEHYGRITSQTGVIPPPEL